MDDWRFMTRLGLGIILFTYYVQTYSEAHPAFCPMGVRGSSPGGKAAET
jgi:hypothetical protein